MRPIVTLNLFPIRERRAQELDQGCLVRESFLHLTMARGPEAVPPCSWVLCPFYTRPWPVWARGGHGRASLWPFIHLLQSQGLMQVGTIYLSFFVSILGISMGIRVVYINTLHLYIHTDMYKCN